MHQSVIKLSVSLACLMAVSTTTANAAELLTNGNFEAGNTGFSSAYVYTPGTLNVSADTFDLVSNPANENPAPQVASYGDHTSGQGLMLALNGATVPNVVAWSETVTIASNSDYSFSGWVSNWSGDPVATLNLSINGNGIGTISAPETHGVWDPFSLNWSSGSATSADISIVDTNLIAGGNDFALDDLSFSAVPEPSSIALLGVAGLSMLRRQPRCGVGQIGNSNPA